jgi:hypothetical protein
MSATHRVTTTVNTGSSPSISKQVSIVSEYNGHLPALDCPEHVSTQISFAAPIASIKNILIFASGAVVLRTNSNSAPDDEFSLTADNYLGWNENNLAPVPFDVDITSLFVANGQKQVETATVIGTIGAAGAGNATVIVTSAGMTGSPITLNVAVANDDTASQVATKIRAALNGNATIAARFTIGGAGAAITLTRVVSAANDGTLNVSIDNGTCTGLTAAPTSANTTPGIASAGADVELTIVALLDVTP